MRYERGRSQLSNVPEQYPSKYDFASLEEAYAFAGDRIEMVIASLSKPQISAPFSLMEEPEEAVSQPKPSGKARQGKAKSNSLSQYSDEDLDKMLNEVLSEEDYERAAEIRDEIKRRKAQEG